MFHRMAIPQEADALHVEPVDAQHKEKKKKKKRKSKSTESVAPSVKRHEKRQTNQLNSRRSKVQRSRNHIQLIIYTQPTIVYTHTHNAHTDWRITQTHRREDNKKKK